jgi:hypothetical protein
LDNTIIGGDVLKKGIDDFLLEGVMYERPVSLNKKEECL